MSQIDHYAMIIGYVVMAIGAGVVLTALIGGAAIAISRARRIWCPAHTWTNIQKAGRKNGDRP